MAHPDCPIILSGCPGVDSPITNISAEAADKFQWAAQIWSPWDPYRPPPLGDGMSFKQDCTALAGEVFANFDPIVFADTQAMANIIALGQSLGCPWNIPEQSGITLQNDAQSATVTCPDGSTFSYTVEAGLYQIDAAILCGYPTDTVTFVNSGSPNHTITHPGCFVQFTAEELTGTQKNQATWLCADGHTFTQSVAGYESAAAQACAAWVEMANQWAQAEALAQAVALMDCITKDDPPAPGEDPPALTPGPGILTAPTWVCRGEEFFSSYNVGGRGSSAYTLEIISGTIPPGLVFTQTDPRRATLSGTTTTAGTYTFMIKGTSTVLPYSVVQATVTVFVFGLTSDLLPDATSGTAYSETLSADGGTAPYTFALDPDSDPLPTGLSLASDGTVSGTPTEDGDFVFDVVVTDANGGECIQTCNLTVIPGFHTCDSSDWGFFNPLVLCATSSNPVWDGSFPLLTTWFPPNDYPMYYFINQSVAGMAAAASDAVNYPAGDWQNLDIFTQVAWDGTNWFIVVACAAGSILWYGVGPATPLDASGTYTYSLGTTGIATIDIVNVAGTYYMSTIPVPATWASPQPTQVRIKDYATVLAAFGTWCGTPCGPVCGTASPLWTGTLPSVLNPDPSTLAYLSEFPVGAGFNIAGVGTEARVVFVPSTSWELDIGVLLAGTDGWYGEKLCGATPVGTYNRKTPFGNPGDPGGCAPGPLTITIESY